MDSAQAMEGPADADTSLRVLLHHVKVTPVYVFVNNITSL